MGKKLKVLIVGASGLLGSSFCNLFTDKYEIITLGRKNVNLIDNIYQDLAVPINIKLLPTKMDVIMYLGQSNEYKHLIDSSQNIFDINIARVLELLNYAKKIQLKQFIYASSGSVYNASNIPHKEDELIDYAKISNFYASSKICAEILVKNYSDFFTTTIIRPFYMFGEHQSKDMLIKKLIYNIKNEKTIFLNGENGIIINPIYVNYASMVLEKLLLVKRSSIFNIAGKEIISIKEICEIVGNKVLKKPIFEYSQCSNDLIASTDKINSLFPDDVIKLKTCIINMIDK